MSFDMFSIAVKLITRTFIILVMLFQVSMGRFNSAINQHINSPGIKIIQGTYHKQPAIHYLNPKTGLNVISRPNGQFWSGWKLSPGQLQNVLQHGGL